MSPSRDRWLGVLLRLAPILFMGYFYRDAMRTWFQQDDFAWLLLRQTLNSPADWFWGLVTPYAQGTVRPISERLFFIWGREFFFLDHRPMHLVVAATQALNLLLLFSLVVRLIGSRWAASLACFTWLCGIGLATPMSWLCTYNQVLISLVFLAGLRAFIEAADTGRRRWIVATWTAFILGFGVLELNVVFPALLTAWVLLYERELWRKTIPFWIVAAMYAVAHFLWIAKPASGVYVRHWDASMVQTFLHYWGAALSGGRVPGGSTLPTATPVVAAWFIALAITALFIWRRQTPEAKVALLGALWFCAVLGPILPLRDHFSEYYLASATPGLAMILAATGVLAWRNGWFGRIGLAILLFVHIALSAPLNREITKWRFDHGKRIRVLVEGLERAIQLHPGKAIFLKGLDNDLFYSGFFDKPFALFGTLQVFLYPGEEAGLSNEPEFGSIAQYIAPRLYVARTLAAGTGQVYHYEPNALRNVTARTLPLVPQSWKEERPVFVDIGRPEWAPELKHGWHQIDQNNMRWMERRGSLILGVPAAPVEGFFVSGYCPREQLAEPLRINVSLGDSKLGEVVVDQRSPSFEVLLPVPPEVLSKREVLVTLEANRALKPPGGDLRELSAEFGRIGFR